MTGELRKLAAAVLLVFFLVGFWVAFTHSRKTKFSATVSARSVQFRTKPLGDEASRLNGNIGLFNSSSPLDLTIAGFEQIEQEGQRNIRNEDGQTTCRFSGVQLNFIDLSQAMVASLETLPGELRMQLQRTAESKRTLAGFEAIPGRVSTVECSGKGGNSAGGRGDWAVYNTDSSLILTLKPMAGKLPKEDSIRLEEGSEVNFILKENPAPSGASGTLTVLGQAPVDIHRILPLYLRNLEGAIVEIQPEADSLAVVVAGVSNDISYAGEPQVPTWGAYIFDQKALQALAILAALFTLFDIGAGVLDPRRCKKHGA